MASATLGKKRARNTKDSEPELPAKRTRVTRNTRSILPSPDLSSPDLSSPDKLDPTDKENQPPTVELLQISTPSKRRTRANPARLNHEDDDSEPQAPPPPLPPPITPQTPRHYNVFANTPRHRVMSAGKISRRSTPRTPHTPAAFQTIYHRARQLFSRSSDPGQLVGRQEERAQLRDFLGRCDSKHPGGCLYVSGPPGTGKSAMVHEVSQEIGSEHPGLHKAYINCMSIKSSKDLYLTLLDELHLEEYVSERDTLATLQSVFAGQTQDVFLLVLDEIDHILSMDLESLYRLLEWSMHKSSRLLLVGIANALDLTDRFLPRLASRNLKPDLLPFLPYTAPQIRSVITSKLAGLLPQESRAAGYTPFFHPAAIELCARKVSSQTGDLRKAFEICRRAIDLVESETRSKFEPDFGDVQRSPSRRVLAEKSGSQTQSLDVPPLRDLTVETAPRVTIGHLNKVTAAAFSNGTSQRLKALNLQQRAALCALMAVEKRNRASVAGSLTPSKSRVTAPTVKALFDTYCVLCKRDSVLHPLSSSEFREVVGSLETLSLVTPVDGKTGSLALLQTPSKRGRRQLFGGHSLGDDKRIASCVGEREIEQAVEGRGADILKSILSGEALE